MVFFMNIVKWVFLIYLIVMAVMMVAVYEVSLENRKLIGYIGSDVDETRRNVRYYCKVPL